MIRKYRVATLPFVVGNCNKPVVSADTMVVFSHLHTLACKGYTLPFTCTGKGSVGKGTVCTFRTLGIPMQNPVPSVRVNPIRAIP